MSTLTNQNKNAQNFEEKKTKYPYESHLARRIAEPLKKWENVRNQAPKQQKCPKFGEKKICENTVNTLRFGFQYIFCFILEICIENIKKKVETKLF